jgi:methyl-accepting chemotaxis protein
MLNSFEQNYYDKMCKTFIKLGFAHIPFFILLAWIFKTEYNIAIGLTTFIMLGPTLSYKLFKGSSLTKHLVAFAMMSLSAIIIHLGKGMIEMHFHIFIALASLVMLGSLLPLITALATVAVHHVAFFFFLPASLFNYEANFGIVVMHAVFAIVHTALSLFIAKKYGVFIKVQDHVIINLKSVSDKNLSYSNKMNKISERASESSVQQATALQEAASSLSEITAMVQRNTEVVGQTEQHTNDSYLMVSESKKSIHEMLDIMSNIDNDGNEMIKTLNENNQQLENIAEIIKQISEKTKVINDIVFQTKLLSFNASVEAARAGENGKGFAVVAEEVGNLANSSGIASQEINDMINDSLMTVDRIISTSTHKIHQVTESSKNSFSFGNDKAHLSLRQLESLMENVKKNKVLMEELKVASNKQDNEIREISSTVIELESQKNQYRKMIEELSNISHSVSEQASIMSGTVKHVETLLSGEAEKDISLSHEDHENDQQEENVLELDLKKSA